MSESTEKSIFPGDTEKQPWKRNCLGIFVVSFFFPARERSPAKKTITINILRSWFFLFSVWLSFSCCSLDCLSLSSSSQTLFCDSFLSLEKLFCQKHSSCQWPKECSPFPGQQCILENVKDGLLLNIFQSFIALWFKCIRYQWKRNLQIIVSYHSLQMIVGCQVK